MKQVVLKWEDDIDARMCEAFAKLYGYRDTIDDKPNPQTLEQFREEKLYSFCKEVLVAHEINIAVDTAKQAAKDKADTDLPNKEIKNAK